MKMKKQDYLKMIDFEEVEFSNYENNHHHGRSKHTRARSESERGGDRA